METRKPPFAIRLLRSFCPPQLLEEIEGDLLQKFEHDLKASDTSEVSDAYRLRRAKRRLLWSVIRFFRPGIVLRNKFSNNLFQKYMLQNQFKFTLRVLSRNKLFVAVSLLGLSISIAACILVLDYAKFELSYDKFFPNHKKIYRLQHNRFVNGELLYKKAMTFPEIGLAMKEYFPEIEQVGRLFPVSINVEPVFTAIAKSGERRSFTEPNSFCADSTFCKVFDLDFIYGNPASALNGKDKIVLSKSTALKYFGRLDVVGETLKGNVGEGDITVTGVFHDLPANTHLKFDVLLTWFDVYEERSLFTWDGFYNYVSLKDGVEVRQVNARLSQFAQSYMGEYYKSHPNSKSEFGLQPLETIHLDSHLDGEMKANGNRNIVYGLLLVACFIIVIAVINQVNLNTSRSLERVKEVGIRKTIGSTKTQLSSQFLMESLLLNCAAAALGILLTWLLYPWFNKLFDSSISLSLLYQPIFWAILAVFLILVSLISGFYPAFMLIRFKVYEALKGLTVHKRKSHLQKALVTAQFAISLILIIGTYALFEQITFMQTKDLGFCIDRKVVVKVLPAPGEEIDTLFLQKITSIKNELRSQSFCRVSTISSDIPGRKNDWRGSTRLAEDENSPVIRTNLSRVDEDFVNTFDLKLVAGRNYASSLNNGTFVITNREAIKQLGLNSPEEAIGKKVLTFGEREIIGVVESFHEAGLHESISPSMYITGAGYMKFLTLAITDGNIPDQLDQIEKIWKTHFPDKPFEYFFLDDFFNRQYQADVLMGQSIGLFSGIAIMIACLGLFSLSVHTIHKRTKEIGIKKILGAGISTITFELCRNFLLPIGLSAIIGIPISYYLIKWWLEQYAFRIDISYLLFFVPLIVLLVIGLSTTIFQSIRAANQNPVDSLRYE
ncbi:MAG: FtsX-like permease family protein [Cyclobacteriaceae bacterium]